jgi:hypothetical protein
MPWSTLGERTKQYLGLNRPSPFDPPPQPSKTFWFVVTEIVLLSIGAELAAAGQAAIATPILTVSIVAIGQNVYRHWNPAGPVDRRGWYLDPSGGNQWRWWDGSGWSDRPPGT